MKYYVLETTMVRDAYKNPKFREALGGHMRFVKEQFLCGQILFSGTKPDNSGGVRVLKIKDSESVDDFWKNDPMAAEGFLEYRVTMFAPLDFNDGAALWFESLKNK